MTSPACQTQDEFEPAGQPGGDAEHRSPLRVLFAVRDDLLSDLGGDSVQIEQTRQGLQRLGLQVDLTDELTPELEGCDLVHVWHLARTHEAYVQARWAAEHGRPIVLSPIYWPAEEYEQRGRGGLGGLLARGIGVKRWEAIRTLGKWSLTRSPAQRRALAITLHMGVHAQRRWLLQHADLLLPNSRSEARELAERFRLPCDRLCVVHNGVDASLFRPSGPPPAADAPLLYVGRIEPRKNVLAIIRAARRIRRRLLVVGRPGVYAGRYFRACQRAGRDHVFFIDRLSQRDLVPHYGAAAALVNASWYETPGLANLEAAACGCRLVVTGRGSTQEYFGEYATYCDPSDADSIAAAMEDALHRSHDPVAQAAHVARFTWQRAAEQTLAAYRRCVPTAAPASAAEPAEAAR